MTIMHRLQINLAQEQYPHNQRELQITVGVTAESAVTPTVIVALLWSVAHHGFCFDSDGII